MARVRILLSLVVVLCLGLNLKANPLEERFGLGARTKAMGGVGIAQAQDFSATYYNPANLALCPENTISVGYQNIGTRFYANLSEAPPQQLGLTHIAQLGACLKLPFNLALGVYGGFGATGPMTLQFSTLDNKARMPLYDYSLRPPSAGLGLAYRPLKWLSFGIATSIAIYANFEQRITLPAKGNLEIDISGTVRPSLPFVGGITVEPLTGLRIAAVFRSARYNKFEDIAKTTLSIGDSGINFDIKQYIEGSFGFSPMQAGLGLSYSFHDFIIASDVTWYQWSEYNGAFLRITPAPDANSSIVSYPPQEDFGFFNIFIPRIGAEYTWRNILSARAGYGYRTSPAPLPQGVAQLLDGSAHMLSLGGGYSLIFEKITLDADIFFTSHIVPSKKIKNYYFGGWAYDTGLSLNIKY